MGKKYARRRTKKSQLIKNGEAKGEGMKKKYIISWGGGVNSTGIIAMIKLGMLPEFTKENSYIISADTGAEYPHFYEQTSKCFHPMSEEGWVCKVLSPRRNQEFYSGRCQNKGLMDYCFENTVMPSRVNRWCTMEYKSKPIKKFRESLDCETMLVLGIGFDEQHRAKARYAHDTYYPLIKHEINREKCSQLAEQAGLPEPQKTGCWFCPYQRKSQWLNLYTNHREMFDKAQSLEDNARTKYKGKEYFFIRDLRLTEQIKKWQSKMDCKQDKFDFALDQHCFCAD